jgi:hypothetical protein
MKAFAKKIIPASLWRQLGLMRRRWITRDDHKRSAREVFTRIYEKKLWGGAEDKYSSGTGSRDSHVVAPYIDAIKQWAADHKGASKTALDMGCGDFYVGSKIYPSFARYIAADIVPVIIESHCANHADPRLEFRCIDAIEEPLPEEANVVFFRQVLQHLSNQQISLIVPKLRRFTDVIITEHLPCDDSTVRYNLDKPHGGGIRIDQNSGVDLELPPFHLAPAASQVILEVPASDKSNKDGIIRTTWYRFDTPSTP